MPQAHNTVIYLKVTFDLMTMMIILSYRQFHDNDTHGEVMINMTTMVDEYDEYDDDDDDEFDDEFTAQDVDEYDEHNYDEIDDNCIPGC